MLADYVTHGTFRAIKRGKVAAAPTDSPVLQGKIAIDQAVRANEGSLVMRHAAPQIVVVDQTNIGSLAIDDSLAPAWFKPTFEVKQGQVVPACNSHDSSSISRGSVAKGRIGGYGRNPLGG